MLFVVLLLSYVSGAEQPKDKFVTMAEHNSVLEQLSEIREDLAMAREEIKRLEEELGDKRSSWRPSCNEELALSERLLFTVVIQGNDSFQILPPTNDG